MQLREDFILRLIRQLVEVIARALHLAKERQFDEAKQALEAGARGALGTELSSLLMVDAPTVVELLGDWRRVLAFAQLVDALGQLDSQRGEPARARGHFAHALHVLTLVKAAGRPEIDAALREIEAHLVSTMP